MSCSKFSSRTPIIPLLLKELKQVPNWYMLGAYLTVPMYVLDRIKREQIDEERRKIEMLQHWLNNAESPSWRDVAKALEQLEQKTLAKGLKKKYLPTTKSSQSVPHNADPSNNTFTVELARYPKVLSALQDLENDYSNLMTDTRKELSNCDREEIKFYLDNLFGIEEFQKCDTIDEVLRKLSRDHIDTFSIGYLKRLIIRFHKDDAIVKSVKEYEEKKEEFLQAEAVEEFRQAVTKLEARAKEKTIVSLTLPKHCTIRTRRDVEELASTPDNQHHKYHTRIIVTPGSIVCVWYVPEALCDDLEQLVKDNIAVFRDDRVEEVSLVGKKSVTISVHEQAKINEAEQERRGEKMVTQHQNHNPLWNPMRWRQLSVCIPPLTVALFFLLLVLSAWHVHLGSQNNYFVQKPAVNHSNSSLPESLLSYQSYLHDIYHMGNYSRYPKPSEFISINRPEYSINTVLVNKQIRVDASHLAKFAFPGIADKIENQKSVVKIEEIGFTSKWGALRPAHFVLIEGDPGSGKSTLSWRLCKLWSEGKLRYKWDLVVLVETIDETNRKAANVYDLLYHPDDSIRMSMAQEIQKREGEGLLIIFDGYDELSNDQRSDFLILKQILSNRVLEKATIVVSSRPIATKGLPAQFKQNIDQHIQIVGFSETDIQRYMAFACKDNIELLDDLRSYVSSRPFILSVMHNPLYCTIVTELYIQFWQDERKGFAPNTLTDLYSAIFLHLLKRSLPLNESSDIVELSHLPEHVNSSLMDLAELAAKGMERRQYIFNNIRTDTLGLMVSVRQLYDVRPEKAAYRFLHLTLQQYLSALYWSQQPQQRQIDMLQGQNISDIMMLHHLGLENYKELTKSYYFDWPHLLFLAGLTKLTSFPLGVIMPVNDSNAIYIGPMCQLLFEAQSSQYVSKVFKNRRLEVDLSLNDHFDWFVIGYCVVNSDNTSSWTIPDVESPRELQLLSDGLHYSNTCINWDQSAVRLAINMTVRKLANEYFKIFPKLYPFTQAISHLTLHHSTYLDDDGFSVLQNLSHYCPNLKSLHLLYDSFVLTETPQLPKDSLVTIGLALPRFSVVFYSLHGYQKLRELHLYSEDNSLTDVCTSIKNNLPNLAGKLTTLLLDSVLISQSCVDGLAHLLNSSLINLKIEMCTILNNDDLITAIASSELKQLYFKNLDNDLEFGKSLARLLTESRTLQEVTVLEYYVMGPMDCDVTRVLVEAMIRSGVKNLTINEKCRESVADISYPRDRVTFSDYST